MVSEESVFYENDTSNENNGEVLEDSNRVDVVTADAEAVIVIEGNFELSEAIIQMLLDVSSSVLKLDDLDEANPSRWVS